MTALMLAWLLAGPPALPSDPAPAPTVSSGSPAAPTPTEGPAPAPPPAPEPPLLEASGSESPGALSAEAAPSDAPPSSPPAAPAAAPGQPIEVTAPEQVQSQVRAAGRDPFARPPNPKARPSEGVYAVGSSGVAPLPPPPPPVAPTRIRRGSWRGSGWVAVRLHVAGPIAGVPPARPTVISLGGGAEGGWRIRQWVALGAGFSRQPHELYREDIPDTPAPTEVDRRGFMTAWDIAFLRLYAPVRGRVDPYIDIGGGLSFFEPARERATQVGGTVRTSVGLDVWITRSVTLGLTGLYRANFVEQTVGHSWQAALEVAIHW